MKHKYCIYRTPYGQGMCCKCKVIRNNKFCKKHIDCDHRMFYLMEECIGYGKITNERTIYEIYSYMCNNENILNNISNSVDGMTYNTSTMFAVIIDYLFSKSKLINIIHESMYYNTSKKIFESKKLIIRNVYNIYNRTLFISQQQNSNDKITKIQKVFRGYIYRKLVKYNKESSENKQDPFTFDEVSDISHIFKFSYKDGNNHIYTYNILEFHHFLKTSGMWNPYNREKISQNIIHQIKLLMYYHNLRGKEEFKYEWLTELQAYTEVSHVIEKAGFYNNVSWFQAITYDICNDIIRIFKFLCNDIQMEQSVNFFSESFELRKDSYVFDFCKEIIRMFEKSDEHYMLCCNFIKALAFNIDEFYNNIPQWLSNIESNINIVNENELNSYTLMYIYDLLHTFQQ